MVTAEAPPVDESAPVGPSAEEENAFLSTEGESRGVVNATSSAENSSEDEKKELPPMEDLVQRIPAPARDLIENLFRARFVTVKRIPKSALKN